MNVVRVGVYRVDGGKGSWVQDDEVQDDEVQDDEVQGDEVQGDEAISFLTCTRHFERRRMRMHDVVCLPALCDLCSRVRVTSPLHGDCELDVVGRDTQRVLCAKGDTTVTSTYIAHPVQDADAGAAASAAASVSRETRWGLGRPVFMGDGRLHSFVGPRADASALDLCDKHCDDAATLIPAHFALEQVRQILDDSDAVFVRAPQRDLCRHTS